MFQDYYCTTSVGSLTWTKPKVCEKLWRFYMIQGIKLKADFTNRILGHFSASLGALCRLVFVCIKLTTSSNGHSYYCINVQNITTNTLIMYYYCITKRLILKTSRYQSCSWNYLICKLNFCLLQNMYLRLQLCRGKSCSLETFKTQLMFNNASS